MGLDKASAYGPLLDTYETLDGRVEEAKILYNQIGKADFYFKKRIF